MDMSRCSAVWDMLYSTSQGSWFLSPATDSWLRLLGVVIRGVKEAVKGNGCVLCSRSWDDLLYLAILI